jgi:hypothetical protein
MKIPIVKMMDVEVNLYYTLIFFWHEHGANELLEVIWKKNKGIFS